MKNVRTLGIAGGLVAAALVGGTLINAAFAAPSSPAASAATADLAAGQYCDTWQKAFADKLGVAVGDLLPAAKAASIAAIDAAVAAGDLTEARGAALKAKVNAATGDACRFFGHPFVGVGHGPKAAFGGDLLNAAAKALGIEPGALMQSLRNGDSLKDVASAKGKDYHAVSQAVHDAAKADLDKAVAAGLAQSRADEILSTLDKALAAGDFPQLHPGHGHFGFPGVGRGDGPDASGDTSAS
ncbi:MAG: hypothetical protein ACXWMN_04710 [Candidatus Limnocylindria bacterium]